MSSPILASVRPGAGPTVSEIAAVPAAPLDAIFAPRSVAVIGASERENSVGRTVFWNLLRSPFGGPVFPVNPRRPSVLGVRTCPDIGSVPDKVDLAVITTPAETVPDIISECVAAGVRGAIVISAGFKEIGPKGAELEREVRRRACEGNLRLIGPNCLGVMNPLTGLNATFAASMAQPGSIAFFSQSGALCTAVLDWSLRTRVGFSAFVSVGSMLDVGWGDLISHFGDDPHTKSIILYMETIGDARSFLSAAREVAMTKPIIVIKAGRTAEAAKAAASHTGSMAGSDDALDAAFRRVGVLRVNTIAELFYMAEILDKQPLPKGPRLTVITNAGGPGVLATDHLLLAGGQLSPLAPETISALDKVLPAHWSHSNPIDVLGDAGPDRYAFALETACADPNSDGLLIALTPQAMTDPTATAERIKQKARACHKPILASWMGGDQVAEGERLLNRAGIPTFPYPDTPARLFAFMWQHAQNLKALYETPTLTPGERERPIDRAAVDEVLDKVRQSGRTLLDEIESKAVLAAYGIPVVETCAAATADEAAAAANRMGYPVVLKLRSETITHKTDVGGVHLNLNSEQDVREAFEAIRASVEKAAGPGHFDGVSVQPMVQARGAVELILGSTTDSQLGPVLLFGSGGQLAEVIGDRALGLPPLTTTLARLMVDATKAGKVLARPRGSRPMDITELCGVLVRFSRLVVNHPWIREVDINPLLASADGFVALDARVILHPANTAPEDLPRPAIRPYPEQYVSKWTCPNGTEITFRPIRPEDEPLLVKFHETLSERTVYTRYFGILKLSQRTSHARLTRSCFVDYDRDLALVAAVNDPETGEERIVAVGRLFGLRRQRGAVLSMLVADAWQGMGIGTETVRRLLDVARAEGVRKVRAVMLTENDRITRIFRKFGFRIFTEDGGETNTAELDLAEPAP